MSRILIVSSGVVDVNMAGLGVRNWEFAKALSKDFDVALAIPNETQLEASFPLETYDYDDESSLKTLVEESQVIIIQGQILTRFPFLKSCRRPLVVDLYVPFCLENLERHRLHGVPERDRATIHRADLRRLNELLMLGDFFICSSEKPRDYWLGMLSALNRINPDTYDDDTSGRKLVDVVPFGVPAEEPVHRRQVLKGVHNGIAEGDRVLLWAGGVFDWLDPLTVIEAVSSIWKSRDDVKVFFMATKHPNPEIPQVEMFRRAVELSERRGLRDKAVFFNDWVPYEERANYLLEADIGITAHFTTLETRFAFRTRMVDYLWAEVPMITTQGDSFGELVERYDLGIIVRPEEPQEMARAILTLLEDEGRLARCRENCRAVKKQYAWDKVVAPLRAFCASPYFAADKGRAGPVVSYIAPPLPGSGDLAEADSSALEIEDIEELRSYIRQQAERLNTLEKNFFLLDRKVRLIKSVPLLGNLIEWWGRRRRR